MSENLLVSKYKVRIQKFRNFLRHFGKPISWVMTIFRHFNIHFLTFYAWVNVLIFLHPKGFGKISDIFTFNQNRPVQNRDFFLIFSIRKIWHAIQLNIFEFQTTGKNMMFWNMKNDDSIRKISRLPKIPIFYPFQGWKFWGF